MGRLDGKIAIVTGAGSGIGEATARTMAREGASVVIADIDANAAERVASELSRAIAVVVNVSDEPSVIRMIASAVETFGGLDILHNNATASSTNAVDLDVATIDMAIFDRLVAVNFKGVVLGCKHAIPAMLARGGGSIVNTASIEAFRARGVRAVYGATKAAIVQYTKSVAVQYGPQGIRCNAVAPGLTLTPAVAGMTAEQKELSQRLYPMPGLCRPEQVADAVLFLASDEAGYVNGTTLMVEGGASIYVPSIRDERTETT
jgi:NAD(P)-dependent dehydrogenase (short-subunit alcohol dehydrogenase family)